MFVPSREDEVQGRERHPPSVRICNVRVDNVDVAGTLLAMAAWIEARRDSPSPSGPCRQICTVNPEFIVDARRDPGFAEVLERADLCVPDGIGILWAAAMLGVRLRERVTGSDGVYEICARAAEAGWRVYFLGAAPGVARVTAKELSRRYPGLQVAGAYAGNPSDAEWPEICRRLQETRPHVLLVAFGHPRQDLWIDRHRAELPAEVAVGVGGAYDFVAGVTRRAPSWMRHWGLEWLHRLLRQPWRWRRMMKLPIFALLVLRQVAEERWRHRGRTA